MTYHVPERYRLPSHKGSYYGTRPGDDFGFFAVPGEKRTLKVMASSGEGWEHVSVSLPDRCPSWADMCIVKSLFWDKEDCVMQLHPPESKYVNFHPYCLHLWRPVGVVIPQPPSIMVGPK